MSAAVTAARPTGHLVGRELDGLPAPAPGAGLKASDELEEGTLAEEVPQPCQILGEGVWATPEQSKLLPAQLL